MRKPGAGAVVPQVLRWENPPQPRGGGGVNGGRSNGSKYDAVAEQLRTEPGKWGVIFEGRDRTGAQVITTLIRQAKVHCFAPRGSFEAVTRAFYGDHVVYARYLGEVDE